MAVRRDVSRRDFIKLTAGSAAALGLLLFKFPSFEKVLADAIAEVPVIWLHLGGCSGCTVSALNSLSPRIQDVLLQPVVPGKHVSLRFHPTIMAAQGDLAMKALNDTAQKKGGYVLIVEGAVSTKDNGVYCKVGENNGEGITGLEHVTTLGRDAMAVIALGTCSSFGGIPSGAPNPTGCKCVTDVFKDAGISTPVINLPGCPPHPDWFIGTVASVLIGGLSSVEVDSQLRPTAFYSKLIHDNCPRRGYFDAGLFAKKFSEPYCLFRLGCKGPVTYADCPIRRWNSGTNWVIGANHPCIGCANPTFPDGVAPIRSLATLPTETPPSWWPPIDQPKTGMPTPLAAGLGVVGGVIAGAAIAAVASNLGKKGKKDKENKE